MGLDQLWGLLSRQLSRSSELLDADSVQRLLERELNKPSVRKWVNGEIYVTVLRTYRDWKSNFEQFSPVSFESLICISSNFVSLFVCICIPFVPC